MSHFYVCVFVCLFVCLLCFSNKLIGSRQGQHFLLLSERRFVDSHVTCARDFMQLNIRLNTQLWQKLPSKIEMHLADKHCKPFFVNSSHVFIRTSHYDCGTKSKVTQDHVIFTNSFIAREETQAGQMVSYFPDVEVGFRCTYNRKKILPISGI